MRNMNDFRKAASFAHVQGHDIVSGGAWIARCARCGQSAYADDPRWGEKCQSLCSYLGCKRPAVRKGLCHAHSAQAARGSALHPIRDATQEPLEPCSLRLPSDVCVLVSQDRQAAQVALVRWARRELAKRALSRK